MLYLIPHSERYSLEYLLTGDLPLRLNLSRLRPLPLFPVQVHDCERQHAQEVKDDGVDDREERRRDVVLVSETEEENCVSIGCVSIGFKLQFSFEIFSDGV